MTFYFINILVISLMFVPMMLRCDFFEAFLKSMVGSIQFIIDEFNTFRLRKLYEMNINAQIIYLEKFLNDKYNAAGTFTDIYITDYLIDDEKMYMGNPDEEDAEIYFGDTYIIGHSYGIGEECIYGGTTWQSLVDDNMDLPAEGVSWTAVADDEIIYIGNSDEYPAMYTFIVHITTTHWAVISDLENEMRSYINRYKLLGTKYTLDIYEEI
ncbi:MAG: hypothetical protein PHW83_11425 [Bacteroidales bacterium]|nr:hypothetical protein [Bacteroidales bacterium]